jgi:urea transporter|tara:strand:+ start:644 stop:850 length:207 start_codon:yes stop_codon:yes gene_type:complete
MFDLKIMLLTKIDQLLGVLFLGVSVFFVVNSSVNITGSVIGVAFNSTLSGVFAVIFFILGMLFIKTKN